MLAPSCRRANVSKGHGTFGLPDVLYFRDAKQGNIGAARADEAMYAQKKRGPGRRVVQTQFKEKGASCDAPFLFL
jgi:hypothetical protein